jgi:hypothetical protein
VTPEPPATPNPGAAATPLAAVVETSGSTGTQSRTQAAKTEPATKEPDRVATVKLEAAATEAAKSEPAKSEPVKSKSTTAAPEAIRPAPKPKMHRHAARKPERRGRYAANRDDVPAPEIGYPYSEPYRGEQNEWQRQWSGRPWSDKAWSTKAWSDKAWREKPGRDDFSENRFRY